MLLLLTTTILSSLAETAPAIDTVVLLMFENRAFDHMMGFFPGTLQTTIHTVCHLDPVPGVNGLKGNEFNLVNTSDPNSQKIYVNNSSPYIGPIGSIC
jgi:phospholipase C